MTQSPPPADRVGFSAHPDALGDLLGAPADVRDRALDYLDRLLRAEVRGPLLDHQDDRDLSGARKLYLDDRNAYRLVYTEQRADHDPRRLLGIYLVAVGRRYNIAVYKTAAERLRQTVTVQQVRGGGMPTRFQAALASAGRPAHTAATQPNDAPMPAVVAPPAPRR